jgi:stage II sporulation protein D
MVVSAIRYRRGAGRQLLAAGGLLLILAPGVEAAQSIRVLMAADVDRIEVRSGGPLWVADSNRRGQAFSSVLHIKPSRSGFLLNKTRLDGDRLTLRAGEQGLTVVIPRSLRPSNGSATSSNGSGTEMAMSGLVHLVRKDKGLLVINQVDLEEYVKGVVPAEVSSTWHPEMLKVQAVAARTYALYQQMLSATREYDVVATVQDQVYRGKRDVDAAIQRAVEDTRGLIVTYQNAPIYAAFSSTAAGVTEDALNVWLKDYPYLKGVDCPFDLASPFYQWKVSVTRESLEKSLRQQGFSVGTIETVTPTTYTRGGRVATLRILHSGGELLLRGEELRKAVGYTVIPSTQFAVESLGQDLVLAGYGAGHAVGMCQWGAKELAEIGYAFSTILLYYYPGTELQNMALTNSPTPPPS